MKNFLKIMVAAIVATGMVLIMAQNGAGFKACMVVYFCVGIMMSAILGVFSEERKVKRFESIRHRRGTRCEVRGCEDRLHAA